MKISKYYWTAFALIVVATVTLSGYFANRYMGSKQTTKQANPVCSTHLDNHIITIRDGVASPSKTIARLCDSITIINLDPKLREIGFGEHDHHQPYNGINVKLLEQGQSFQFQLDKSGAYKFHDHFYDTTRGEFVVVD